MASIGQRTDNHRWYVQFYVPVRQNDGTVRAVARRRAVKKNTEDAAIALKKKIEKEIENAELEEDPPAPTMTLGQLSDLYQAQMQLENPNIWRVHQWTVLLRYLGAETPIDAIDLAAAEDMARRMDKDGYKPSTINQKRAALRHALRWAADRPETTGLTRYPLERWKRLNEAKKRRPWVFYSAAELSKIEKALEDDAPGLAVRIAIETGMRLSEILAIRARDLRDGRLFARESKHGNSRWVPIPAALEKRIRANLRGVSPEGPLFPPSTLRLRALQKAWEKLPASAKVRQGVFHDLRHTFISRALAAGVGLWRTKYLAGHKSIQSTMVYAHFAEEPERGEPVADIEAAARDKGLSVVGGRRRKKRKRLSGARTGT